MAIVVPLDLKGAAGNHDGFGLLTASSSAELLRRLLQILGQHNDSCRHAYIYAVEAAAEHQ